MVVVEADESRRKKRKCFGKGSKEMKKYKVGVALSGGSMKGAAHVGVLKALGDLGIKIDILSGVSAGAIVAAMYADGCQLDDITDFFKKNKFMDMVNFNFGLLRGRGGGLADVAPFRQSLRRAIKARSFEELNMPIIISATELGEGKNEYFTSGELIDAIIASASIPGLFNPVRINQKYYIDGGIMSNLAANVLRNDCEYVIGIHVNPIKPVEITGGFWALLNRTFDLVINGSSTENEKASCDIVIETEDACRFGMFETSKAEVIREIGYRATIRALLDNPLLPMLRASQNCLDA